MSKELPSSITLKDRTTTHELMDSEFFRYWLEAPQYAWTEEMVEDSIREYAAMLSLGKILSTAKWEPQWQPRQYDLTAKERKEAKKK